MPRIPIKLEKFTSDELESGLSVISIADDLSVGVIGIGSEHFLCHGCSKLLIQGRPHIDFTSIALNCLKCGAYNKLPRDKNFSIDVKTEHFTKPFSEKKTGRKCSLSHFPPCEKKISGEHFLSKAVLKQICSGNNIRVAGLSWTKNNLVKVGIESLTTNTLCRKHNADLSNLDAIAAEFFRAIRSAYGIVEGSITSSSLFRFDGFQVEKWLLKICFGIVEGGLLMSQSQKNYRSAPRLWSEILLGHSPMPRRWGLYMRGESEAEFINSNAISISIACDQSSEIIGANFGLAGVGLTLLLCDDPTAQFYGRYRPCGLFLGRPPIAHRITLDWGSEPSSPAVCMTLLTEQEVESMTGKIPPPRL